jgi:hypothetical protein
MANEALIKMIDTYIDQLKEIRNDLDSSGVDIYNTYTDKELAFVISKILNRRDRTSRNDIIKDLLYLTDTRIVSNDDASIYDLDISEFEKLLLDNGYKVTKENYGSSYTKNILEVLKTNGTCVLRLRFGENGTISKLELNTHYT